MPSAPAPHEALAAAVAAVPGVRTPALVLDLDALEHNVRATVARLGAGRWMPHVKTAKQRVAVAALLAAGVRAFKAATLEEVDLVRREAGPAGVTVEVLLAHPAWGATARGALARLGDPHARLALLADGPEHLAHLRELAAALGTPRVPIYLDVDVGMHRTGRPAEVWLDLRRTAGDGPFEVAGVSAYEGHLGWDDRAAAFAAYEAAARVARAYGAPCVVTSGSHTFHHARACPALAAGPFEARVSPGTVVFSDRRTHRAAAHLGLRQAVYVATRVVSAPRPGRVTCDAGSKAIAPDCPAPGLAVLGHPALRPLERSEEHLPLAVERAPAPAPGDLLLLVPDHACTTVNLHRMALWVRTDRVVGHGPVEARGHGLFDALSREVPAP